MSRARPNVFTIAPGADFAETTARALIEGRFFPRPEPDDPLFLADVILYVPTRRAGQEFARAFTRLAAPRPAILPDIRPLAEPGDALERLLAEEDADRLPASGGPARRSISTEERAFLLVPAIAAWQRRLAERQALERDPAEIALPEQGLAGQLALGDALGRLIDEMAIEGEPLARLAHVEPLDYDPSRFDDYWSMTRDFLGLAARQWPDLLEAQQAEDGMTARLARIAAETARLAREPGSRPVIVAGSTGSVRATAELMQVVARLERGAVILPGLDRDLDRDWPEGAWAKIGHPESSLPTRFAHPQASLKRSLQIIGIGREEVHELARLDHAGAARNQLFSEALRPAETAHRWQETRRALPLKQALAGLQVVEAADEREEARAIALLMRETLETPGAEVVLVTADRDLARRVTVELGPLGITPADSAGEPLAASPAGVFTRLFLAMARQDDSASLLAFLRHPLCDFGLETAGHSRAIDALEIFVCRTGRFDPALPWAKRVAIALDRQPKASWPGGEAFSIEERHAVARLAAIVDTLRAPFRGSRGPVPLGESLLALRQTLADLVSPGRREEMDWQALGDLLDSMARHGAGLGVSHAELPLLLSQAMARVALPPLPRPGARARILGFLEARLVQADRVILGGLNEGSVPPATPGDPFLNRAMRLALGLQPAERRIGQSAHDIMMLAGHEDLVLTRAQRVGTTPGIPSRFLRRLAAFAGPDDWKAHVMAPGTAFLKALRDLDAPGKPEPIAAPAIIPARPRLPARVSITEFETFRRDPYAIYARRILRLPVLEPLDPPPDARQRGTVLHAILESYARQTVPVDAEAAAELLGRIGLEALRAFAHEPEAFQFWSNAFRRIIPGFVAYDAEARAAGRTVLVEAVADYPLMLPCGEEIRIRGKADRIETQADGAMLITDYKTGASPKWKDMRAGLSPQLGLTGALAMAGAFGLPATRIAAVSYLPIGGQQAVRPRAYPTTPPPLDEVITKTWAEAVAMLDAFARGELAYRSRLVPREAMQVGDYDYLARGGEWSIVAAPDDMNSEPDEDEA